MCDAVVNLWLAKITICCRIMRMNLSIQFDRSGALGLSEARSVHFSDEKAQQLIETEIAQSDALKPVACL